MERDLLEVAVDVRGVTKTFAAVEGADMPRAPDARRPWRRQPLRRPPRPGRERRGRGPRPGGESSIASRSPAPWGCSSSSSSPGTWFGFGSTSKTLLAFIMAFFPVLVNSIEGFSATDSGRLELVRSLLFWTDVTERSVV